MSCWLREIRSVDCCVVWCLLTTQTASLLTFLTYVSIHEEAAFAVVEEEVLREVGEDGEVTSESLGRLKHCTSYP